ncbi:hypothetical protein BR93DRAFT_779957 [Coniochaeta sp. PMI_546]|nr:hypothetical protein BR93DRAFT_779957 [Coniochaeta sp. PMI_546]
MASCEWYHQSDGRPNRHLIIDMFSVLTGRRFCYMLLGSDESNVVNLAEIRGWTFQGYLLSPRTLDFGTYQTTYKCLKFGLRASCHQSQDYGICEEKLGAFRSRFYDLHARGDLEHGMRASQNWKTAVELFTRTDLTVPHWCRVATKDLLIWRDCGERA